MNILKGIMVMSLSALFLSGCATTNDTNLENKNFESSTNTDNLKKNEILDGKKPISLSSLKDVVFELKYVDGKILDQQGEKATISFSYTDTFGDIVRGFSGCNHYFTPYSTQRSVLITGEFIATDNKCDANGNQVEAFLFNIYSQKPILTFENNDLKLKAISNELIFKRVK